MNRRGTGILGEKLAADFLKKRRYHIIETNYRCPHGEIDIIARHGRTLVFTEVRTKTGTGFGTPGESVTALKRDHLRAVASYYIQTHPDIPEQWRIDFIGVFLRQDGAPPEIEHIENAVGGE